MAYFEIIWDEEPGGNVEHVAEHGLTPEDVEEVIFNPVDHDVSRSSLASHRMGVISWLCMRRSAT
jgi:hypothetical protein